ncbi:MAG: efflux RND transporter periplasmic adaptor subunit [Granulosicoccaceae bacterium]
MKKSLFAYLLFALTAPAAVLAADYEAHIAWAKRVTLSTPVSGVVDEVLISPGAQVKKGQVLLRLVPANFNTRVQKARAAEESTRYALAEAEREFERAQELYERTVLADHDLKLAEIAYKTAKAHHSAAQAELADARQALADSVIRAPFDGIVLATHVTAAETVVTRLQNVPMISMAMTGHYRAHAALNATSIAARRAGETVEVRVDGKTYSGKVLHAGVEADTSGRYLLAVEFDSSELLRSGIPATIVTP